MTTKEQIRSLIEAQDMIRQVYVQHDGNHVEMRLKQLDKEMSSLINLLGRTFEKKLEQ